MKKITVALLLLVSMLMVLCAGCGSSDAPAASVSATMAPTAEPTVEPEPTAEPEPTEEPVEETVEPVEEEPAEEEEEPVEEEKPAQSTNSNSGNNSNSNSQPEKEEEPEPTAEPEPEVDKYEVASGMAGSPVSDLYAAIGEPNGSEYTASCLMPTGEDGLLYYDDFTVSTIKYPDGTELVMGVF